MYLNHHLTVRFWPSPGIHVELRDIESTLTGAHSWCWPTGLADYQRGRGRPRRSCLKEHEAFGGPCIYRVAEGETAVLNVPWHLIRIFEAGIKEGRWPLLKRGEESRKLRFRGQDVSEYPGAIPDALLEMGEKASPSQKTIVDRGLSALERSGLCRDLAKLRFYQAAGAGLLVKQGVPRPALILNMPGGTGKTVTSLAAAVAVGARKILVVCPAAVRSPTTGWPADIRRFFAVKCRVLFPPKDPRRKKEGGLDVDYEGVAVVAVDGLGEYVEEVRAWKPDFLIWDELDTFASRDVRDSKMGEDGGKIWFSARTSQRKILTEAAARVEIAELASLKHRLGLTATLVGEGDLAPLIAMLNLVDPGGWGYYSTFDARYQQGVPREDSFGTLSYGPSNVEEMRARLAYLVMRLPTEVGRHFIPASQFEIRGLSPVELGSDSGYSFTQKEKEVGKAGGDYSEIRSARAAAMKRKAIFEELDLRLRRGERCVVFTRWIGMAEKWAEMAAEKWPDAWVGVAHAGKNQLDEYAARAELWLSKSTRPLIGDVIFANIGVAGRGTNALIESHWMAIAELVNNPGIYQQILARSERPKQVLKDVLTRVDLLVAQGTSDDDAMALLAESAQFSAQFAGSDQAGVIAAAVRASTRADAAAMSPEEQWNMAEKALRGYDDEIPF